MSRLGNALLDLIDNSQRQALSLRNEVQRAIDSFDFDATIDSLLEGSKTMYNGFSDFMKTIKESVSDVKVIVPFNEKKEKYTYEVSDGVLKVTVRGKGTLKEASTTLASNCLVDNIKCYVDKKNANLVVVVPKDVTKDENLKKIKNAVTEKATSTAEWLRKALSERADETAKATTAPSTKPKSASRAKKPNPTIARGSDGRFVSNGKKKPKYKKKVKETEA